MSPVDWHAPVSDAQARRRASGRRHYNALRSEAAQLRRHEVAKLMLQGHSQAQCARELGLAASTVSRDWAALLASADAHDVCPTCGRRLYSGTDADEEGAL